MYTGLRGTTCLRYRIKNNIVYKLLFQAASLFVVGLLGFGLAHDVAETTLGAETTTQSLTTIFSEPTATSAPPTATAAPQVEATTQQFDVALLTTLDDSPGEDDVVTTAPAVELTTTAPVEVATTATAPPTAPPPPPRLTAVERKSLIGHLGAIQGLEL